MYLWRRLNHPHIAALEAVYQTENSFYLVSELLPLSLSGFIKTNGMPSRQLSLRIIEQLLEAVEYMHGRGIMHRDIKPENIMLRRHRQGEEESYQVLLIDFGLAHGGEVGPPRRIRCGTPGYTAPEILDLPMRGS